MYTFLSLEKIYNKISTECFLEILDFLDLKSLGKIPLVLLTIKKFKYFNITTLLFDYDTYYFFKERKLNTNIHNIYKNIYSNAYLKNK